MRACGLLEQELLPLREFNILRRRDARRRPGQLGRAVLVQKRPALVVRSPCGAVDGILHGLDEERLAALHAWAPAPVRRRIVRWAAEDRTRRSPVTGTELVALGLSGPAVGRALARIRAGFLDGEIANREEALALGRELARRGTRRSESRSASRRRRSG